MFGKRYIRDYCISCFKKEQEDKIYRMYLAKCFRLITENTAKLCNGSYISVEFEDIINPKPRKEYKEGEAKEKIKNKLRG